MSSTDQSPSGRCVVVGAGLAGLAAADVMVSEGWQTTLIDPVGRAGGVIETIREDGWLIERSADSFLTSKPEAVELVERLGLGADVLPLRPTSRRALVLGRGELYPVPAGFRLMAPGQLASILRSPLLSPLAKLRVCLERFVPASTADDESLESFAIRRLGREAYERLVQPLVSGIWTADPTKLSMAAALPDFLSMEKQAGSLRTGELKRLKSVDRNEGTAGARYGQFVTLASGLDTFPRRWCEHLQQRGLSCLQARVDRVDHVDTYRVQLAPTPTERSADTGFAQPGASLLEADTLIVSTPATPAAALLQQVCPALSAELGSIAYAGSAIVSLGFPREAVRHPLNAAGLVIPRQEGRSILAISFSSSKFPGRAPEGHVLMRVFLGGALDPEAATLNDETLSERAIGEVADLLGVTGTPSLIRVARWEGAMPQYHLGHRERVARIRQLVEGIPGCGVAGAALNGVGIPQVIASGRESARQAITSSSCRLLPRALPSPSSSS